MQKSPITPLAPLKYGFRVFFHIWPTFLKASLILTFFFLCIIIIVGALLALLFNNGAQIVWGKLVSLFYSLEKAPFSTWLYYFYNLKRFVWIQVGIFFWMAWIDAFSVLLALDVYNNRQPSFKKNFIDSFVYLPQFIVIWFLILLPDYLKIDTSGFYLKSVFALPFMLLFGLLCLLIYFIFLLKISLSSYFIVEKKYTTEQAIGASWQLTQNHFLYLTKIFVSLTIIFFLIIISTLYSSYHLFHLLITLQKQFLPIFSLESTVFIPLITIVYLILFSVFFGNIISMALVYTYKKLLNHEQTLNCQQKGLLDASQ